LFSLVIQELKAVNYASLVKPSNKQKGDPLGIAFKMRSSSLTATLFEPMPDPASKRHQGCWALLGLTLLEVRAFR